MLCWFQSFRDNRSWVRLRREFYFGTGFATDDVWQEAALTVFYSLAKETRFIDEISASVLSSIETLKLRSGATLEERALQDANCGINKDTQRLLGFSLAFRDHFEENRRLRRIHWLDLSFVGESKPDFIASTNPRQFPNPNVPSGMRFTRATLCHSHAKLIRSMNTALRPT